MEKQIKPEPLSHIVTVTELEIKKAFGNANGATKKNILNFMLKRDKQWRSAVEWLKLKIYQEQDWNYYDIIEKVKEAFPIKN